MEIKNIAKCKDCKSNEWEFIWYTGTREHGFDISLFQCKKCKRVIADAEFILKTEEEL